MENVAESVALLRKQAQLESQILNGTGAAIASEQALEATRRRLASRPQALNAVLQTRAGIRSKARRGLGARSSRVWLGKLIEAVSVASGHRAPYSAS
jgi:hypothetical protein